MFQVFATLVVALAGFIAAGALAGVGFALDTSTSTSTSSSTSSSTSTTTETTTTTTTTPGGEGCTPGYWKQSQHFDSWPVNITMTLAGAGFTATGLSEGTTLLSALSLRGGPTVQDAKNILLRAAAAAYLSSLAVDYPLTTAEVVSMVNTALASGDRETILGVAATLDRNNNLGCTLS